MYYADIKDVDVANGPGIRISLFVSGCRHHCKGCFNEEAWNFNYGEPYTEETTQKILTMLENSGIEGLSILGGEPLDPANIATVVELCVEVRKKFGQEKTIWIYSGYTFDQLMERKLNAEQWGYVNAIFNLMDILVDGPFIEALKDPRLKFRGSSNQRILNAWLSWIAHVPVYNDPKDCPPKSTDKEYVTEKETV